MTSSAHPVVGVRIAAALSALLLGATACSGGDDDSQDAESKGAQAQKASDAAALKQAAGLFHGVYVGKAGKSDTLVAVVAEQSDSKKQRDLTLFVCDGDGTIEFFPAAQAGNEFKSRSDDGDATATGTVTAAAVTGKVRLQGGRVLAFRVPRGSGAAGLYGLDVNRRGALSGASEAGVGATGRTALSSPGRGYLDIADGRRLRFAVRQDSASGMSGKLARVIVSPEGWVAGALVQGDNVVTIVGRPARS